MKKVYKEKNFIKVGRVSLISLPLMILLLIHLYIWNSGDPFEHLLGLLAIPYISFFGILIITGISLIIGIFFTERKNLSFPKKIMYLLLSIFIFFILFLISDFVIPEKNIMMSLLTNVIAKTENRALCEYIPEGSIFWRTEEYSPTSSNRLGCYRKIYYHTLNKTAPPLYADEY